MQVGCSEDQCEYGLARAQSLVDQLRKHGKCSYWQLACKPNMRLKLLALIMGVLAPVQKGGDICRALLLACFRVCQDGAQSLCDPYGLVPAAI